MVHVWLVGRCEPVSEFHRRFRLIFLKRRSWSGCVAGGGSDEGVLAGTFELEIGTGHWKEDELYSTE